MKASRHIACLTLACGLAGCAVPPTRAAAALPAFSSVADDWQGTNVAARRWTDATGMAQRLVLHRRTSDGAPYYVHHAVSAVCGDAGKASSCKIHRFLSTYDGTGAFQGYTVEGDFPFTKREHDPFTLQDYRLLDRILRDPTHPVGTMKSSDSAIDGVTGATADYLAESAVPGAFYTSYTVWRIVNRTLPDQIRAWTVARATADEVTGWITGGRERMAWWYLDHADESPLPAAARMDVAYAALASMHPRLQAAAIRFLERNRLPFRPAAAVAEQYGELDDTVRIDFLEWWKRHDHAPVILRAALLAALQRDARQRKITTGPVLVFLSGNACLREDDWQAVLRELAAENPSTYVRAKAAQLLRNAVPTHRAR